jgi:hypothetical protein|tara:strand:- start:355 stop:717 length:363 start_codon:yes stop_codon:yes gene_type:complete
MGGSSSKRKGYRVENELVKYLIKRGIDAKRQPLSGALSDFPHDIQINNPRLVVEVKARKSGSGFKTILNWMGKADVLVMKQDYDDPIVAMPMGVFVDLIVSHADYEPPYIQKLKEIKKQS